MNNLQELQRVCAYARVSTKAEKQDTSLQSQIQYYTNLIDSNPNYINKGVYAEKKQGGNQHRRSEFLKMIQECRNRNIDIIYTKTIARFGRNHLQLLRTLEELTRIGVRVIFELEDIDTLRDKQSIRTVIQSYFAEDELVKDSLATKFGIKRMFEQGKVRLSNPYPLFGYRYGKNRKLILEPKDAKIVKEIFDRYCNGERSSVIIRSLNDRGITTASGKEWNYCTLNDLLRQEKYMGIAYLQKTYSVDGKKIPNKGERVMYVVNDFCEPIISKEQFEKAKEMRTKNTRFDRKPDFKPEYDCFKGKIKCGQCGANYNKLQSGNRVYASGTREKVTYQCRKVHTTSQRECRNKVQSRQALEDAFIKAFNTLRDTAKDKMPITYHNEELSKLDMQIKQMLEKEKVFLLLEAREQMTPEFKKEYNKLVEELLKLQARKREIVKHNGEIKLINYNTQLCEQYFNQYTQMEKFDEQVFTKVIKEIVVINKNRLLYNFINGYTADVEIIDYYARNDEIGEVKVYVSI